MVAIPTLDTLNAQPVKPHTYGSSIVTFERPANTTAYTVDDVISHSTVTPGHMNFLNCGKSGWLVGAQIVTNQACNDLQLILFEDTAVERTDNSGLLLASSQMANICAVMSFSNSAKINVNGSPTALYVYYSSPSIVGGIPSEYTAGDGVAYQTTDGAVKGNLITKASFTPSASTKFCVRLNFLRN